MNTTYLSATMPDDSQELSGTIHVNNNLTAVVGAGAEVKRSIVRVDAVANLPAIGSNGTLYLVSSENAIYAFDENTLTYVCVGRDYNEIGEINAGGVI